MTRSDEGNGRRLGRAGPIDSVSKVSLIAALAQLSKKA
jgi:hypothetical protein